MALIGTFSRKYRRAARFSSSRESLRGRDMSQDETHRLRNPPPIRCLRARVIALRDSWHNNAGVIVRLMITARASAERIRFVNWHLLSEQKLLSASSSISCKDFPNYRDTDGPCLPRWRGP